MLERAVAPFAFSLISLLVACSSSSDTASSTDTGDAGSESGGARATGGAAGSDASADAGSRDPGGDSNGGTSGSAGSAATVTPGAAPCSFSVTGGNTFPSADAMFLCAGGSALTQSKGMGKYSLSFGAASYTDPETDSSIVACTLDSQTPPKAGDTWVLGTAEHPGNCSLNLIHDSKTTIWDVSDTGVGSGTVSVTFVSATLTHGMYKPENVYYLFEIAVTASMKGAPGQTPQVADISLTGHFKISSLPIGS